MAKFEELPDKVLRLISVKSLNELYQHRYCLDLWKNALSILAVYRHWRHIAKDVVYAHAIVEIDDYTQSSGDPSISEDKQHNSSSNLELIAKNGVQHMVQRLYISAPDFEHPLHFMLSASETFVVDVDECPKLKSLRRRNGSGDWAYRPYCGSDSEYFAAVEEIVDDISHRYPNVCVLDTNTQQFEDKFHTHFLDTLIEVYAKQLTQVRCCSRNYFPQLDYTTQLQTSRVKVCAADYVDVAPLKPGVLECLWLGSEVSEFFWNDLRYDKRASMVRFDYLKKLVIKNPNPSDTSTLRNTSFNFGFEFPQLACLVLENVKISPGIADSIMRAPLRQLDFTGLPTDALLLCSRNTGSLEKLALSIDCNKLDVPNDKRATPIRALFSHLRKILEIWCNIGLYIDHLDITDIDFSNFTHLDIRADIDVDLFVSKLPTMQKLTKLSVSIVAHNAERVTKANGEILRLKETHAMPILINICDAEIRLFGTDNFRGFLLSDLRLMIPHLEITQFN